VPGGYIIYENEGESNISRTRLGRMGKERERAHIKAEGKGIGGSETLEDMVGTAPAQSRVKKGRNKKSSDLGWVVTFSRFG